MARLLRLGLLASLALAYLAHLEGVATLSSGADCVDNMGADGPSFGNFHGKGRELSRCVREYRQKHGTNFECGSGLRGRTCVQLKHHFQSFLDDLRLCLAGPTTMTTMTTMTRATTTLPNPRDCKDLFDRGETGDQVTTIYPDGETAVLVRCIDEATVILNRDSFNPGFDKTYAEYAAGFGNRSGDYYLGNDALRTLTSAQNYKLRVDIVRPNGTAQFAEYTTFQVGPADDRYRLTTGGYSGDAGDALAPSNGIVFNTKDNAVDASVQELAAALAGGWWMTEETNDLYATPTADPGGQFPIFTWGSVPLEDISSARLSLQRL